MEERTNFCMCVHMLIIMHTYTHTQYFLTHKEFPTKSLVVLMQRPWRHSRAVENEDLSEASSASPATLTSTSVDLQLPVDVGFVYQWMKYIKDTVNIPDFRVRSKEVNLLLGLLGSLAAVLTKWLELLRKKEKMQQERKSQWHSCAENEVTQAFIQEFLGLGMT